MGKKQGSFKEVKLEDAPQNIKDLLGKQDEGTAEKNISGRERDFVQLQKEYHVTNIGLAILSSELETFMEQVRLSPDQRTIKWNGMVMPDKVLKAHTLLKNQKYIEGIHEKHSIKKSLLNFGLTEEQLTVIGEDGKYVKELPKDASKE